MPSELRGRPLVAGDAAGGALVLPEGLSFAMGFDPELGVVRDVHGSATGTAVAGRILVMGGGRGSSSASTALAEAVRLGTAPAAILIGDVDEILAVGAIIARRLYGRTCPIVLVGDADRRRISDGQQLGIRADGTVLLE